VYNSSKSHDTRVQATLRNKEDLYYYLNPSIDNPMIWTEIHQWLDTGRGRRAMCALDMQVFSPDTFLNDEWNRDIPASASWYNPDYSDPNYPSWDIVNEYYQDFGRWVYRPVCRSFYESVVKGEWFYWVNDAEQMLHVRPSTPEEQKKFGEILKKGNDYRDLLIKHRNDLSESWKQEKLRIVFKHYVQSEKPLRSLWTYIILHKNIFLESLQYYCNYLLGDRMTSVWTEYSKQIAGQHRPLNTNSAGRLMWMSKFAKLAYYPDGKDTVEAEVTKKFGGLLENDLVTTKRLPNKKDYGPWAKAIKNITGLDPHAEIDWPVYFGDIQCRLFVTAKPKTLILAFRGTSTPLQWAINFDFTAGDFFKLVEQEKTGTENLLHLDTEDPKSGSAWEELEADPDRFQMHRGFVRAVKGLYPFLVEYMHKYFRKYRDLEHMFFTGHSLGAAMTQVAALMLPRLPVWTKPSLITGALGKVNAYRHPHCYMFSSPLVGDQKFQSYFSQFTGESAHSYIDGDIVTMIPPFLVPGTDPNTVGWKYVIEVLRQLNGKTSVFSAILYMLSLAFENMNIASFPDGLRPSNFTKKGLSTLAEDMVRAAAKYGCHRGGGVFFRLEPDTDGVYEKPYDPGSTNRLAKTLSMATLGPKFFLDLHSIDNIVHALEKFAKDNPDIFDIHADDMPGWAGGKGGKPRPDNIPVIDPKLLEKLLDPNTKIIGYAHTKHQHKPWTIVSKDDVDQEYAIFMPSRTIQDILQDYERSHKRRRVQKADHTYYNDHHY